MIETINTVNIAGAALISQISLLCIMAVGAMIIHFFDPTSHIYQEYAGLSWLLLSVSLISLFVLVYSEEFSTLWTPVFRNVEPNMFTWSTSVLIMFLLDIICVSILVRLTGGSPHSPFTPIYFIIPALSIFLREDISRIMIYLLLVSVGFSANMFTVKYDSRNEFKIKAALWFVSIACFMLATYIGYITSPSYETEKLLLPILSDQ